MPIWACLLFTFTLFSLQASAHPFDLGSLRIQLPGNRVRASLLLPTPLAKELAGWKGTPSTIEALDAGTHTLFAATLALAPPILQQKTCGWDEPVALFAGKNRQFVELSSYAHCPKGSGPVHLDWALPFLDRTPDGFELMVHVEEGERNFTFMVSRAQAHVTLGESRHPALLGFFRLGIAHIGAWPSEWYSRARGIHLPEGIDHICFVLALLVSGGIFWEVLKNVTGFTIGHSLTLALAAYRLVAVNPRFVEACVALSIAFVAGSALWRGRSRAHGWLVAFAFGTIHGLAFASALNELELSRTEILRALLGFNLGVEAGQCVILAITFPILALIRKYSERAYQIAVRGLAGLLLVVGLFWFAQRLIGA